MQPSARDYKSQLQEYTQGTLGLVPSYGVKAESGPEHKKVFDVVVSIGGDVTGRGTGPSKKSAEQEAARIALDKVNAERSCES